MGLSQEERVEALSLIEEYQNDGGTFQNRGCSPVKVQIGSVKDHNDMIRHDTLILEKACSGLIQELQDNGFKVSMKEGKGLWLAKY